MPLCRVRVRHGVRRNDFFLCPDLDIFQEIHKVVRLIVVRNGKSRTIVVQNAVSITQAVGMLSILRRRRGLRAAHNGHLGMSFFNLCEDLRSLIIRSIYAAVIDELEQIGGVLDEIQAS